MEKYGQIIRNFKDVSIKYHVNEIKDFDEYLKGNPDSFKAYMIAKFLQLDSSNNSHEPLKVKYEFENKIKTKKSYTHFFFGKYINSIQKEYRTKGGLSVEDYEPLKARAYENISIGKNEIPMSFTSLWDDKTITEIAEKNYRITILGGEGTGKTFTNEKILKSFPGKSSHQKVYPIYVRLEGAHSIENRITDFLKEYSYGRIDKETILNEIPQEQLLFLFDGIDELSEKDYWAIKGSIDKFLNEQNSSRVIISSRPLYYFVDDKPFGIDTYILKPLTKDQKNNIINTYFEKKRDVEKARILIDEINNNERLAELTNTPQNLTSSCESFLISGQIPRNEAQIYENLVKAQERKNIQKEKFEKYPLFFEDIEELLETVAYDQFQNNNAIIKEILLVQHIRNCHPTKSEKLIINQLVDWGYVQLIDKKQYVFRHKAWEKFFAAKKLYKQNLGEIEKILEDKRWDEVITIVAGLQTAQERNALIEKLMSYDLELAAKCIAQESDVDKIENHTLIKKLASVINDEKELKAKRMSAINSLGITRTSTAKKLLIQKIHKQDEIVSCEALEVLAKYYPEEARKEIKKLLQDGILKSTCLHLLINIGTENEIELLLSILKNSKEDKFQLNALFALENIKSEKAIDVLIAIIKDNSYNLGHVAARILGKTGTSKIKKALWTIIKDNKQKDLARSQAATALGIADSDEPDDFSLEEAQSKYASNSSEEKLMKIDSGGKLLLKAAYSLGRQSKGDSAYGQFNPDPNYEEPAHCKVTDLLNYDYPEKYIEITLNSLKTFDFNKTSVEMTVEFFINKLDDNDINEQTRAIEALRKLKQIKSLPFLEKKIKKENVKSALYEKLSFIIQSIHPQKGEQYLLKLLEIPDKKYRIALFFGHKRSIKAVKPIIDLLKNEKDSKNREYLITALSLIADKDAAEYLLAAFINEKDINEQSLTLSSITFMFPRLQIQDQEKTLKGLLKQYTMELKKNMKNELYKTIQRIKTETQKRYLNILETSEFA